jgi:hypothetical protein
VQHQGRLNSIIGPGQSSALGPYLDNHRNKNVNVDKIKHIIYLLYLYFQQNQCLIIKKHAIHNLHALAWGPYGCEAPGQLPGVPMHYDGTVQHGCPHIISIL